MTIHDLLKNLFPTLSAREQKSLATHLQLHSIGHDGVLRTYADTTHPSHALQRNAEAAILKALAAKLFEVGPDDEQAIVELVAGGQASEVASLLLKEPANAHAVRRALVKLARLHSGEAGVAADAPLEAGGASASPAVTRPVVNSPPSPPVNPPTPPPATKESPVATFDDFVFDQRSLPDSLKDPKVQQAYVTEVRAQIRLRGANGDDPVLVAAVVGGLLRQAQFNVKSNSVPSFVAKLTDQLLEQQKDPSNQAFNALQVCQKITDILLQGQAGNGAAS
jgi:hypothetical protein